MGVYEALKKSYWLVVCVWLIEVGSPLNISFIALKLPLGAASESQKS